MRRIWILAAVLALLLTACAGEAAVGEPLPLGEGAPAIPSPPAGKLGSVEDMENLGGWVVLWEDLSEAAFTSYVAGLKADGWTSLYAGGNEATTGAMLEKGSVALSMAYSEPSMTLLVLPGGAIPAGAIPDEIFPLDDVPAE